MPIKERFDRYGEVVELERFVDAKALLGFNSSTKRIVDLCNKDFEDDPFDEAKNYSTWHRALDGQEVWNGIVRALESLYDHQRDRPWEYLPEAPPEENLHQWMKSLRSADWWMEALQPEASPSAFRAWFSNRPMGKKKVADVHERVNAWWAKLQEQVALARRYTFATERERQSQQGGRSHLHTWDTWCKDRLEEGLSADQVRDMMVDECLLVEMHSLELLDFAIPNALRKSKGVEKHRDYFVQQAHAHFGKLLESGFPRAIPRKPPEFDPGPAISEHQWGDRRQERCSKDMNVPLYNIWYRESETRWWNADTREIESATEIVAVSQDGQNWRDPNEREKQGWDSGDYWFAYAFEVARTTGRDVDIRNSYERERDELLDERRGARHRYEYSAPGSEHEAKAKADLDRIEAEISNLHLRE
ncbi:hypothetical protein EE36_12873 [Sulfitobacter sp. EE-36]|nr:hypothetical protein EE36_12873 [Sulfitobacter sp. EE-36]